MAEEVDRTAVIVGVVGAAAVIGGVLYFAFSSKSPASSSTSAASTTPTTPTSNASSLVDQPTSTPSPAPTATTFEMSLSSDTSIQLKPGQTTLVHLPNSPTGAWTAIGENHDGSATSSPTNDPNAFVVTALTPGVAIMRFAPINSFGPQTPSASLSISITS